MTYFDACKELQDKFADAGVPEPAIDARYLVEYVCEFSEAEYLLNRTSEMPAEQYDRLLLLADRRCKREPLQYIIGSQEFMGLPFICTKDCLIPRQDTEILVEHAMDAVRSVRRTKGTDDVRVADICTGSGCIIVSLAKLCKLPGAVASDISEAALAVAARNASENGVQIDFRQSDLFEKFDGSKDKFDIIVSNPPYIDTDLIHGLIPEIWEYEPMVALDGGDDGLLFYRKIVDSAAGHLAPGGWLMFEIGDTQGEAVSGLMRAAGYENVSVHKDLAGLDRVVKGTVGK